MHQECKHFILNALKKSDGLSQLANKRYRQEAEFLLHGLCPYV